MPTRWNPQTLFNVYPSNDGFTCVGTTLKGLRCRCAIAKDNRMEASSILEAMAARPPNSSALQQELTELAFFALCRGYHSKPGYTQVTAMVGKWSRTIDAYSASLRSSETAATSQRTREQRHVPGSPQSSNATIPTVTDAALEAALEAIRLYHRGRTTAREAVNTDSIATPVTPPRSLSSSTVNFTPPATPLMTSASTRTSAVSSQTLTPPSTPPSSTTDDDYAPSLEGFFLDSTTTSPSSTPTTPRSHAPSRASSTRPRTVTQRPITSPCSICYETIDSPDDAVWCRAQCGQNVHRSCFREWRNHCMQRATDANMDTHNDSDGHHENGDLVAAERTLAAVTCAFCRTRWQWSMDD